MSQPFSGLALKGTGALEISRLLVKFPETNEEFIICSKIEPCNIIVLDLLTNKQGFHYWYSYPLFKQLITRPTLSTLLLP